MKKVWLEEIRQNEMIFYTGKADPRLLVRMADDIQVGEVQDAQRPLDLKQLKEIAEFVGTEKRAMLPSVMIATKKRDDGKFIPLRSERQTIIHEDGARESQTRYYMEFPETEAEIAQYQGTINIIDGQHRIFAFRDELRSPDLKDDTVFELNFCCFVFPDLRDRRTLFMVTNEKQRKVAPNLLYYLRDKLGLLKEQDRANRRLIERLASEDSSPLKNRIILSAEKRKNGLQAKELNKILTKYAFPDDMLGLKPQDEDDCPPLATENGKFNLICRHLEGWERYYGLSFGRPGRETMTKIAGLRYILCLMPAFWNNSYQKQIPYTADYVQDMIEALNRAVCQSDAEVTNVFDISINYRSESITCDAAREHARLWQEYLVSRGRNSQFNPLA